MRRPRPRLLLGLGIPLLIVVVLLAAWAIDSSSASGKVPRNVTLGGRDVSKLAEDALANTVADLGDHYARVPVQVRTPGQTFVATAAALGLKLDQEATIKAALDLDHRTSLPGRPLVWVSSFLHDRRAPLAFTVSPAALQLGLRRLTREAGDAAEPRLMAGTDAIEVVSGSAGLVIDPAGVGEQLLQRARSGEEPIIVTAKVGDRQPRVSDTEAQQLADVLNANTARPLVVDAGGERATIDSRTVRSWLGAEVVDGKLQVGLDAKAAKAVLSAVLPPPRPARDASITLAGGRPVVIPSEDGRRCCTPDTWDRLKSAVVEGTNPVAVDLEVTKPGFPTEAAQALGVKEPVGTTTVWKDQPQVKSFTTYYDPGGGGRVTNIHRIADLVRGTLVKPGETFSVNRTVGARTAAKGFVKAGAIANGEHVEEIGGGVSQFATTMFNAAYFAGLPITTYQAHSEHFSRYPRGREATMGYPNPDLAWKNDTRYGILVWTSHTAGSVTVTLYSTQGAWGEQTGSREGRSGSCTVVTTERTIHHPDGTTTTDTFRARYRVPGQTTC